VSEDESVLVFEGTLVEVDMLKSVLNSKGTSFSKDNYMGAFASPYASPGGVNPIKIVVQKSELKNAQIIEKYIKGCDHAAKKLRFFACYVRHEVVGESFAVIKQI